MTNQPDAPTCPRHPDRVAFVSCQHCGRPVCHECQRPAAVGVWCPDCARESARSAPAAQGIFGGRVATGRPIITLSIIGICVAMWAAQLASGSVTDRFAYVPVLSADEPWRFVTAAFLHDPHNPLHLAFNMYALWICGQYLEPLIGRARFAAMYLITAVGGSVGYELLASVPSSPNDVDHMGWLTGTVGASGAVFGLFAAVVVLNRRLHRDIAPMVTVIGINAVLGFIVSGIAWQAHLGGLITGAVLAGVIAWTGRRPALVWGGMAAVLVILAALATWRYQSVHLVGL